MTALEKSKGIAKKFGVEVADRVNPKTIGGRWKKIMYISSIVSSIGAGILLIVNPVTMPAGILIGIKIVTVVSGGIAGRGFLDKSKKK